MVLYPDGETIVGNGNMPKSRPEVRICQCVGKDHDERFICPFQVLIST
jgi:hypothetical protein